MGEVTKIESARKRRRRKIIAYIDDRKRTDDVKERFCALEIDGAGLVGAAEVAEILDVRIQNFQFIKDLPLPIAHLRASRVWCETEIREFAKVYAQRREARSVRAGAA